MSVASQNQLWSIIDYKWLFVIDNVFKYNNNDNNNYMKSSDADASVPSEISSKISIWTLHIIIVIINLFLLVVVVAILYILFTTFIQIQKFNCKVKHTSTSSYKHPEKVAVFLLSLKVCPNISN